MKKTLIGILVSIACLVVVLWFVRNEVTDRFNPFISMEHSYAKVEKGTQMYKDVQAYDNQGRKLVYRLSFNGFDPDKEYVDILHKGKYVKEMHYIKSLPSNSK